MDKKKRRSGKKKTTRTLSPEHKAAVMKNLRPWQPGQTGNPNGRPRVLPNLNKLLAKLMGGKSEDDEEAGAALIIKALAETASTAGDRQQVAAANALLERMYGRVKGDKEESEPEENKPKRIIGFNIKKR